MKWLRPKWRRFRLWLCRKRGHNIVQGDIAFGYYSPDRYIDGKIVPGESVEWRTILCEKCDK